VSILLSALTTRGMFSFVDRLEAHETSSRTLATFWLRVTVLFKLELSFLVTVFKFKMGTTSFTARNEFSLLSVMACLGRIRVACPKAGLHFWSDAVVKRALRTLV